MDRREAIWLAHQRARWMRPDADQWMRPDAARYLKPVHPDERKYSSDQPRVPAGNPDGGQWTSDELGQSLTTASDQSARNDLTELEDVANDLAIRPKIDDAWNASNPDSSSPQEHGFWISRSETSGELFTRPFANSGSGASIVPGPTPSDAIAFFHTHPNSPDLGFIAGPSRADLSFANSVGLPGMLQSHNGMYYFGPTLRSPTRR